MLLVACEPIDRERPIVKEAKFQVEKDLADFKNSEDGKKSELTPWKTIYSSDTLCILRSSVTGKNALNVDATNQIEYLYLKYNNKIYHCAIDLTTTDSVYISRENADKLKKGSISEDFSYEQILLWRAIRYFNWNFAEKDGFVKIPLPLRAVEWELETYVDEYGEKTNDKFISIYGFGTFDNSATTYSDLLVCLIVDKEKAKICLFEYNSILVKQSVSDYVFTLQIRDSSGETHYITMLLTESGQLPPAPEYMNEFFDILKKEGTVNCFAEFGKYGKSRYRFKFDLTGFNMAYSKLTK